RAGELSSFEKIPEGAVQRRNAGNGLHYQGHGGRNRHAEVSRREIPRRTAERRADSDGTFRGRLRESGKFGSTELGPEARCRRARAQGPLGRLGNGSLRQGIYFLSVNGIPDRNWV